MDFGVVFGQQTIAFHSFDAGHNERCAIKFQHRMQFPPTKFSHEMHCDWVEMLHPYVLVIKPKQADAIKAKNI